VRSTIAGRVVRVDVSHGAAVTAGAAILWIEPG
jgi:biotin carboxyl carrier protein